MLALLAPVLARGRHATPFFAVVTVLAYLLTLDTTPLHRLFYLIPQYEAIHQHDPWRVVAAAGIGPPLLAAASLEALRTSERFPAWVRALLPIPFLLLILVLLSGEAVPDVISLPVVIAALLATLLVAIFMFGMGRRARPAWIVPGCTSFTRPRSSACRNAHPRRCAASLMRPCAWRWKWCVTVGPAPA